MSGFTRDDYAYLARLLVFAKDDSKTLHALASNNLNIILAALDIAAAESAPRTAEPEADGDRTVHPMLDRAPATELLRRITELEKLVNETTKCLLSMGLKPYQHDVLADRRNAWLKSRTGEWV